MAAQKPRIELDKWLTDLGFSCQNLNHRFADGTEMAKLLKRLYPRRVELHNYSACSCTEYRMNNWNTLNQKVLAKLKLPQNKTMLEALANAAPGAAETLLFKIMQKRTEAKMLKMAAASTKRANESVVGFATDADGNVSQVEASELLKDDADITATADAANAAQKEFAGIKSVEPQQMKSSMRKYVNKV